jgi:hypothetical protein
MRILISEVTRSAGDALSVRERSFDDGFVSIGRSTDQLLQVNDPRMQLQHAQIRASGNGFTLSCQPPAQATVNNETVRNARLAPGDVVLLGALRITVGESAVPGELRLTVEHSATEPQRETESAAPTLTLAAAGWRKRPWAWGLFLVALLCALVLPWAAGWPSDANWSSGPLHAAHSSLEQDCKACHVKPFERVRNETCLDCHAANLHRHLPADHPAAASFEEARCTDCHVEHDEPSHLVQRDSRTCTDCHAEPMKHGAREGAQPVTDFARQHPPFRINAVAVETPPSGLKFTHAAHLDPKGIKAPQGDVVMKCADCHVPDAGAAGFAPVKMEAHCSSCHRLDFDPAEPERAVPHGDPAEALRVIVGHYSARYLGGYVDPKADADKVALPPGIDIAPAERARLLGQARERALRVATDLFERRACVDCHEVRREGTAAEPVWKVTRVKLPDIWMPQAIFDHAAHGTSLTPCSTCHAAETSKTASDVLMPGIETCRDCHGGERGEAAPANAGTRPPRAPLPGAQGTTTASTARIPSACIDCHGFHGPEQPLWRSPVVKSALARLPEQR